MVGGPAWPEHRSPEVGGDLGRPPGGERRQVTALFYDIVGSTRLLASMDAEDFLAIQEAVHDVAAKSIADHGGHLAQISGDGGVAFFGYPAPREEAAEEAVAAGLEIAGGAGRIALLAGQATAGVPVRVGVATHDAVLPRREAAVAGSRIAADVVGMAPTLAARVQAAAAPGTVAVSRATFEATKGLFDYEPMGRRRLKGFDRPEPLWRPVSRRQVDDRFSATRSPELPLVGREEEIATGLSRWRRAKAGHGQILLIRGEAGVGKSRLAAELRLLIQADGGRARIFQCQPQGAAMPLKPILDALRAALTEAGLAEDHRDPAVTARYIRHQAPGAPISADVLSFLLGLLPAPPAPMSDAEIRAHALRALEEIISGWSADGPQMLLVEDTHWADELSLDLLDQLADTIKTLPVLLVITSREELFQQWVGEPNLVLLSLSRLDTPEVRSLIEAVWGKTPVPDGLVDLIQQRSDGVPLFVEELTRLVREEAAAHPAEPTDWDHVLGGANIGSLEDLLAARLSSFNGSGVIARAAAVAGREFDRRLLEVILGDIVRPGELDRSLDRFVETGLIRSRRRGEQRTFTFRHVLFRDAIYRSTLRSDRRNFHARIAEAAASNRSAIGGMSEAELAAHCEAAGADAQAVGYLIGAAEHVAKRSLPGQAVQLLDRAERILERLPAGESRDAETLRLVRVLGPLLTTLEGSGSARARALYERGLEICRDRTEIDAAASFPVFWGWWFTAPDFATQRTRADLIVATLSGASDPEVALQAYHCAWATAFNTGRHRDCLQAIEHGAALYDAAAGAERRNLYGGHDAMVCGLGETALSRWFLGAVESCVAGVEQALDLANRLDHLGSLAHALDIALMLRRYRGDAEQVVALSRRMSDLATTHGLVGMRAKSLIFGGWARALTGALAAGDADVREGLAILQEVGTEEDFPVYHEMAAQLAGRLGRPGEAAQQLVGIIGRAETTGHRFWLAELYRRRGRLAHAAGLGREVIEAALAAALEVARDQGAQTLVLRALADLARLAPGRWEARLQADAARALATVEAGPERARAHEAIAPLLE